MLGKLGFHIEAPKASFTGGLVGDSSPFAVLPTVTMSYLLFICINFSVPLLTVAVIVCEATQKSLLFVYLALSESISLVTIGVQIY